MDSNDGRYQNDGATGQDLRRGEVIRFHDIHKQTVRVLDDWIAR